MSGMLHPVLDRVRSTKPYARLAERPMLHQFVRYALVGVLNVALHFTIFNVLLWAGRHTLLANAVAFVISSINSFVLNKLWAFKDPRRHAVVRQYLGFVTVTLIGLGINTGALSVFLIPLERFGTLGKNIAVLCALPFSITWNFLIYRYWTFRAGTRASDASAQSPEGSER